jgi:uncharacterized protein
MTVGVLQQQQPPTTSQEGVLGDPPQQSQQSLSAKAAKAPDDVAVKVEVLPDSVEDVVVDSVWKETRKFYQVHSEIKESHGIGHVEAVYRHAVHALAAASLSHDENDDDNGSTTTTTTTAPIVITATQVMEIKVATILHDVDDGKYFPNHSTYENATSILQRANVPVDSHASILDMISWVSCSKNGNNVPESIQTSGEYFRLIPRWSDRLEAVGAIGVVRCYQYNQEHGRALFSASSPRAQTVEQVWEFATPERFATYQQQSGQGGGSSISDDDDDDDDDNMISHYYDKLLHVAHPPPGIVRNAYLEAQAEQSSCELIKVCLEFGKTGKVNVDYIENLAKKLRPLSSSSS